jgi:hypothetical protein
MGTNATEQVDGYLFVCKLCGKDHEVPEEIAPRWRDPQTFVAPIGDLSLGCPESLEKTALYLSSEFTPYKLTA